MTTQEFSNEFDVLYNNITSNQAPGLDEYEKSVFLTSAQEEIVISLYNGKNPLGESLEKTEELRRYLSSLIKTYKATSETENINKISDNSYTYSLPDDLWYITYEAAILEDDELGCMNPTTVLVVPITQDNFYKINRNPFKCASKNRVLRLDNHSNKIELISKYNISTYIVRYLSKLKPIILEDLQDGLSINGISEVTECELIDSLHRTILKRAVELAKQSWSSVVGN